MYNRYGRRDNIHKARIKILVKSLGIEDLPQGSRSRVAKRRRTSRRISTWPKSNACARSSMPPPYEKLEDYDAAADRELEFQTWYRYNTRKHKVSGYRAVFVSLKKHGTIAGRHDVRPDGGRRRSRGSR